MNALIWLAAIAVAIPIVTLWCWALAVALDGIGKEIALLIKEITQ